MTTILDVLGCPYSWVTGPSEEDRLVWLVRDYLEAIENDPEVTPEIRDTVTFLHGHEDEYVHIGIGWADGGGFKIEWTLYTACDVEDAL